MFYHHINPTAFLDIEFIPLPGQVLAYYIGVARGSKCLSSSRRYLLLKLLFVLIKSSLAPLIDSLMQTLAGRFHIDVERPENDTSQGFSEIRWCGFGG